MHAVAFAAWKGAQVSQALAAIPRNQLDKLTARIRAEVDAENPPNSRHIMPAKLIDRIVAQRLAKHVADNIALPTLEQWLARARR